MEQDYVFPVVIRNEEDSVVVKFIDFDLEEQRYKSGTDYISQSKIILSNALLDYENTKATIPTPKRLEEITIDKDEQIVFLNIWLPFYRTENEKYIKKTLTIPYWIDELAKKQSLNFSQILKEALLGELGLPGEIRKRKIYRFDKPMRKFEEFIVIAQKMIGANVDQETDIFLLACNTKDYNLIVTIWVIWVNKNISCFLKSSKNDNIKKSDLESRKQEWLENAQIFKVEFEKSVIKKCNEMVKQLRKLNNEQSSIEVFSKYIVKFAQWLVNASLKYNGAFERKENIYDKMRAITSLGMLRKNIGEKYWEEYTEYYLFTRKYDIEVPYLYVLAWNIEYIYSIDRFNNLDKERKRIRENICYKCLKKVSNTTLEVLLGNPIFSERLERKVIASKKMEDGTNIPVITKDGNVKFSGYLPYLDCREESISEYRDVANKIVSEEVLEVLPMIPMYVNKADKVGIKYLLNLLCAEVEQ